MSAVRTPPGDAEWCAYHVRTARHHERRRLRGATDHRDRARDMACVRALASLLSWAKEPQTGETWWSSEVAS